MHVTIVSLQIIFSKLIEFATIAIICLIALRMFRATRVNLFDCVLFDNVFTRSNFLVDNVIIFDNDVFVDNIFIRNNVLVDDIVFVDHNVLVDDNVFVDNKVFVNNSVFVNSSVFVDNSILIVDNDVWLLRIWLLRRRIRREKISQLQLKYSIQISRLSIRKLREFYKFVFSSKKQFRIVDFVFLKYFIVDRFFFVEILSNFK